MKFEKIIKNNTLWAMILVIFKSIVAFFLVPYVTERVGIVAYGYVSLANTMITYIDIVAVSFNYFAQRYISVAYHKGDYESSNRYYSSVIIADLILCMLTSLPAAFFICKCERFLNIKATYLVDIKILFALILVKYFISLLASSFEVGAFLTNRYDVIAKNRIISTLIQFIIIVLLFECFGRRVYYVGIASLIYELIIFVFQFLYKRAKIVEISVDFSKFSISSIVELFSNGIWMSLNNAGNILNNGLDLLITNLMVSEVMMGQISIAKMVSSVNYAIVSGVSESFKPKQIKLYSLGKKAELIGELKYSMKISGTVFIVLSGVFISCGKDFLSFWLKEQEVLTLYYLLIICVFSDLIPSLMKPLYYVYTLAAKTKIPCLVTLGMGAMNVLSMYLFLKYTTWGGYVVVLTTLVINSIHLLDSPLYSAYCLGEKLNTFYDVIIYYIISCGINSLICLLILRIVPVEGDFLWMIVKGSVSGLVAILISIVIMFSKEERKRILGKDF